MSRKFPQSHERIETAINISKSISSLTTLILLCLPAMVAKADDAKTHFDKGISLFKVKKNDAALEEFATARKLAPNDSAALYCQYPAVSGLSRFADDVSE